MWDKLLGCIAAGAMGDALGYEVEFWQYDEIISEFGKNGLTQYVLHQNKALISDDTQMTLFTMNGLILAKEKEMDYVDAIYEAYQDWLKTQMHSDIQTGSCWLLQQKEMYAQRAPGMTCLDSLMANKKGSMYRPINHSKGCGGIMRVAPIAFLKEDKEEKDELAAKVSALTHGHEMGYIPSYMLVHILSCILEGKSLRLSIEEAMEVTQKRFENTQPLCSLVQDAITLSRNKLKDIDNINLLGQGWVAEETLAIALYCCLRHENDFGQALISSINHSGDSDSTGAVTGNIMGTIIGFDAIEDKWKKNLEGLNIIVELCKQFHEKN